MTISTEQEETFEQSEACKSCRAFVVPPAKLSTSVNSSEISTVAEAVSKLGMAASTALVAEVARV